MSGSAFAVLMDERAQARERVKKARAELERLARSVEIGERALASAQADLDDFEAAMRLVDPAMTAALLGDEEPDKSGGE